MRFLPSLFSVALFTSAFLSFSIQPILGKMLLPMVGGAPASWIVAMAFFQLALLAGYGISYFLSRFSPWVHACGLIALYAVGFCFVPPVLPAVSGDAQGIDLSLVVIKALFQTVFVPFIALTATTAALQRVFSATNDPTAKDPYYLFVASNAGSFAGLFIYPFILEPLTGVAWQSDLWKYIYVLAIVLIATCCLFAWNKKGKEVKVKKSTKKTAKVPAQDIVKWIILSFMPCSLSMGVTTLITTDIGGLPLFWVVPLGLYLLTFIIAFSSKPILNKKNAEFYHVVAATFMVLFLGLRIGYQPAGVFAIFIFLAVLLLSIFFFIAWACHQRLADSRPDPQHLTQFYFIIALGGALAGILHAFIIPFVLPAIIEFPVMVLVSLLLVSTQVFNIKKWTNKRIEFWSRALFFVACVSLLISFYFAMENKPRLYSDLFSFVFLFITLLMAVKPRYLMLLGLLALTTSVLGHYPGTVVERGRNFFGVQAIYDIYVDEDKVRVFSHGNTIHGMQVVGKEDVKDLDYGYYLRGGPIEDGLKIAQVKTLGIIGLGAGQLACFDPKLTIDFYEIDQDVERASRDNFVYLHKCPPRKVIIGDGRLMLQKENKKYDMIIIDAFSSDGIPLHLITKEAVEVYMKQLNKNGMLLFHVSNRYLDLGPPLAAIGESLNLVSYKKYYAPVEKNILRQKSFWFAMSIDKTSAKKFEKMGWKTEVPQAYVWTDDRSSILSAFAWDGAITQAEKMKK